MFQTFYPTTEVFLKQPPLGSAVLSCIRVWVDSAQPEGEALFAALSLDTKHRMVALTEQLRALVRPSSALFESLDELIRILPTQQALHLYAAYQATRDYPLADVPQTVASYEKVMARARRALLEANAQPDIRAVEEALSLLLAEHRKRDPGFQDVPIGVFWTR